MVEESWCLYGIFAEGVCGETASIWRVCACLVGGSEMMNSSSRSNDDGVSVVGVEELNLSLMRSFESCCWILLCYLRMKNKRERDLRPRRWCYDRFVLAGELPYTGTER